MNLPYTLADELRAFLGALTLAVLTLLDVQGVDPGAERPRIVALDGPPDTGRDPLELDRAERLGFAFARTAVAELLPRFAPVAELLDLGADGETRPVLVVCVELWGDTISLDDAGRGLGLYLELDPHDPGHLEARWTPLARSSALLTPRDLGRWGRARGMLADLDALAHRRAPGWTRGRRAPRARVARARAAFTHGRERAPQPGRLARARARRGPWGPGRLG